MTSIWRSRSVVAALVVCAGTVIGCGLLEERPAHTTNPEENARAVAAQIAAEVGTAGGRRTADYLGRVLAIRGDADLVAISGVDTVHPDGVTAVLRIRGRGVDDSGLALDEVVEEFCFELRFPSLLPASPPTVPCPSPGARLSFPPLVGPRLPSPDQLRAALSASAADQASVRAALAKLSLDPSIRIDVAAQGEFVGVALRATVPGTDEYRCLFARKQSAAVQVWRPPAASLQPGELACTAAEAIAGWGSQPPK